MPRRILLIAAVSILAIGACGGGDDGADDATTTTADQSATTTEAPPLEGIDAPCSLVTPEDAEEMLGSGAEGEEDVGGLSGRTFSCRYDLGSNRIELRINAQDDARTVFDENREFLGDVEPLDLGDESFYADINGAGVVNMMIEGVLLNLQVAVLEPDSDIDYRDAVLDLAGRVADRVG